MHSKNRSNRDYYFLEREFPFFYGARETVSMSKAERKIYNLQWWNTFLVLTLVLVVIATLVLAAVEVSRMEGAVSSAISNIPSNRDIEGVMQHALTSPQLSTTISESIPVDQIIEAVIEALSDLSHLSSSHHNMKINTNRDINSTYIAETVLNKTPPSRCSSSGWCQTAPQCVIYKDIEHCQRIAEEIMCICGFD